MTDITKQLADALREAEDALASSYEVADYPANGRSQQDVALAKVRAALTAFEASRAAPDDVVERVARAICAAFPMGWDGILEAQRDHLRDLARAALSALPAPADDGPTFGPLDPRVHDLGKWEPARDEALEALAHYADQYCEGWCNDAPAHANFIDCGGCKARLALARAKLAAPAQEPQS